MKTSLGTNNYSSKDWVAILDFGSQYTQLIARRVRECGVLSVITSYKTPAERLLKKRPKAIILSGSPATVTKDKAPVISKEIFELGIPILGICYGMQLAAKVLGGRVESSEHREYGSASLSVDKNDDLFKGLEKSLTVWMSHGDRVLKMPAGFQVIAHTNSSPIASMRNKAKKIYGLQFHPEVVHTPQGRKILNNFLKEIAACSNSWTMKFLSGTLLPVLGKKSREIALSAP